MDVFVLFQSPTGRQENVMVTERSSEEATIAAATRVLGRPDWLPIRIEDSRWWGEQLASR